MNKLLGIVSKYCDKWKMTLTKSKTNILTLGPENSKWFIPRMFDAPEFTAEEKAMAKYLGVKLAIRPRAYLSDLNKDILRKARNYAFSIMSLSKDHLDRCMIAREMWETCAIPGILYATDCLNINQGTIDELDSIQSMIAKFILQIHSSSSNIGAVMEVGFMPMKFRIAKKQVMYYKKMINTDDTTIVKQAFMENINGNWNSLYAKKLMKLFKELKIYDKVNFKNLLTAKKVNEYAQSYIHGEWTKCAKSLCTLTIPSQPQGWFKMQPYINDSFESQILNEFKCGNAKLGNRMPIEGGIRVKICPFCTKTSTRYIVNETHVITQCIKLNTLRSSLNIGSTLSNMEIKGVTPIRRLRLLLGVMGQTHKFYLIVHLSWL